MSSNNAKVESSITNWVVYALLSTVSLLIATSVHRGIVIFTAAGITTLFVLSYMSKPVAEIRTPKQETIFDKNKINRITFNQNAETNPQRKRYLRSIDDLDNAA